MYSNNSYHPVVNWQLTKSLINSCYLPNFKLLSYELSSDSKEIVIFMHGVNNVDVIKALAKQFGVEFKGETAVELASTIDAINGKFKTILQRDLPKACAIMAETERGDNQVYNTETIENNALGCLIWNRQENAHAGVLQDFVKWIVHGHDGQYYGKWINYEDTKRINMDTNIGKQGFDGDYRVFITTPTVKNQTTKTGSPQRTKPMELTKSEEIADFE